MLARIALKLTRRTEARLIYDHTAKMERGYVTTVE
jgi:hypothetical protein